MGPSPALSLFLFSLKHWQLKSLLCCLYLYPQNGHQEYIDHLSGAFCPLVHCSSHLVAEPRGAREPNISQAQKLQVRYPGLHFVKAAENYDESQFDPLVRAVLTTNYYSRRHASRPV